MAVLTANELAALAISVGLTGEKVVTAVAIALAESGGRSDAMGDTTIQTGTWGPSVGPWQIRSLKAETGKGTARDAQALLNPQHNARAMKEISADGTNWRPWSVYTSGAYRLHLPAARVGAGSPGQIPAGGSSGGTAPAFNIADGGTWSRAGLFVFGGAMIAFVAWRSMGIGSVAGGVAKTVAKVVK